MCGAPVHRHQPDAIGLIDGAFRDVRAVWHREILWALSQGIHVFGAASMGALRAAELDRYGMRGVGRIYEAYRDGIWPGFAEPFEDDDEVAVQHAPAELGYAPLSDAMADLRETLLAAEHAGTIDAETRLRLTAALKAMYFPERSLRALEALAGVSFRAHAVPRKRLDALALLDALAALRAAAPGPFVPDFRFEPTLICGASPSRPAATCNPERTPRRPPCWTRCGWTRRPWQACALAAEGRDAVRPPPPSDLPRTLTAFGMRAALLRRAELDAWLAANGLDEAGAGAGCCSRIPTGRSPRRQPAPWWTICAPPGNSPRCARRPWRGRRAPPGPATAAELDTPWNGISTRFPVEKPPHPERFWASSAGRIPCNRARRLGRLLRAETRR